MLITWSTTWIQRALSVCSVVRRELRESTFYKDFNTITVFRPPARRIWEFAGAIVFREVKRVFSCKLQDWKSNSAIIRKKDKYTFRILIFTMLASRSWSLTSHNDKLHQISCISRISRTDRRILAQKQILDTLKIHDLPWSLNLSTWQSLKQEKNTNSTEKKICCSFEFRGRWRVPTFISGNRGVRQLTEIISKFTSFPKFLKSRSIYERLLVAWSSNFQRMAMIFTDLLFDEKSSVSIKPPRH